MRKLDLGQGSILATPAPNSPIILPLFSVPTAWESFLQAVLYGVMVRNQATEGQMGILKMEAEAM
jgi:hypothetical protein